MKSTVPIGTGVKIKEIIKAELIKRKKDIPFDVVSNPEFLREGNALYDALNPERVVIGCDTERSRQVMEELYKDTNSPIFYTSVINAEMIKYASNSYLATKISFINELARLCDKLGVNVTHVAEGMGMDTRIGPQFLKAGIGYGGSCFPKDTKALLALASKENTSMQILEAVTNVNKTQIVWFMEKLEELFGTLSGKRIAVLGLSFKPQTDDIRDAPSLKIIKYLIDKNAIITAYDPKATKHVQSIYPSIQYAPTPFGALKGADAVLIVTEWKEIIEIDWKYARKLLSQPYIFDGRNALDSTAMKKIGYLYVGVGI